MNRWTPALIAACLSWTSSSMAAAMDELEQLGSWTYQSYSGNGGTGCIMVDNQAVGDGRLILGVVSSHQTDLLVFAVRPSWSILEGTLVSLKIMFPGRSAYTASGVGGRAGGGGQLNVAVPKASIPGFLHDLVTTDRMDVEFRGTEPTWSLVVSGADIAIAAMKRCVARRGFLSAPVLLGNGGTPTRRY